MARSQSRTGSALLLLAGWMAALASLPLLAAATAATPEAVDLNEQYLQLSNTSLRWMQRPNLYFGMRARVQGDSPLFGLMWYGMTDYQGYTSEGARFFYLRLFKLLSHTQHADVPHSLQRSGTRASSPTASPRTTGSSTTGGPAACSSSRTQRTTCSSG